MRHTSIQRAEAEYQSALALYHQIKKVEEILLSILMVIKRNAVTNAEKAREYEIKAWAVFDKNTNASVFNLADVNSRLFGHWFDGAREDIWDSEIYEDRITWIRGHFDNAKLAQIKAVKAAKTKLDFEKS